MSSQADAVPPTPPPAAPAAKPDGVDRSSGIILALLLAAAFALVGSRALTIASGPTPPHPGSTAPSFKGMTPSGGSDGLDAYQGKVILVDFWATWCPPCVAAMPGLERAYKEYGPRGFVVLGVNQEPGEEAMVASYATRTGLTFPIVVDPGSIARDYGVYAYPTSFLIGRDGIVRAVYRGPASEARLRTAIESLLAAPAPASP